MPASLLDPGIEIIRWLVEHRVPWLDAFFLAITDVGSTVGYLVILPLVWWGVSWKLGARVFFALVLSVYLNALVKDAFAQPRPFLYADVPPLRTPDDYSFPSGHAQNAAVVWGLLALHVRKRWFTAASVLLVALIGLSRMYLAVHFPSDVLAGWALGAGVVFVYARWSGRLAERARRLSIGAQMSLALGGPALLTALSPLPYVAIALGGLAGALGGLAYALHRGLYRDDELASRSRRASLAVGLLGLPLLYLAIRALAPAETSGWYAAYLFLRFAAIGLWVSFLVPRIVDRVKQSRSPSN